MNVVLPNRLTVDEFLAWAVRQEKGRYELVDGAVLKQQPQTWGHVKTRMQVFAALCGAIHKDAECYVAPNGPTVRVNEDNAFAPDALVVLLPEPDCKNLEVSNAVVVVEVLSPSTARMDVSVKLKRYFEVPSVQHYLILDPEGFTVTHHKRGAGDALETRVVSKGAMLLDPPGLVIEVWDIFGSTSPSAAS